MDHATARHTLTLALLLGLLGACAPGEAPPGNGEPPPETSFALPAGIPAPEFGIEERLEDRYTRPDPWDRETPGWYYVHRQHPDASDERSYGTPAAPRATVPDPVPAGSVVVLAGTYDFAPAGYDRIVTRGTAAAPVFLVGEPGAVVTRKWVLEASYTIVEGLEFTDRGKVVLVYPSHHVALRNNEHHHLAGKIGGRGNSDAERVHDVVIYNNKIHSQDGWDQNPDLDLDNHGIKFDAWVDRVWVLNNEGYHNGGNFIQIGDAYGGDLTRNRYFYVGGNRLYANRQSPIGVKQASDVVISENELFDNRKVQNNAAGQSGIVFQYGPDRLWILFNHIHDSNAGITGGSNSGGTGEGPYIVGNLIHGLRVPPDFSYNPDTGWAPAAVMLAGGNGRYVIDNTIYDVDGGIHTPSSSPVEIHGNLVAEVRLGYHLFLETTAAVTASRASENAFFQTGGPALFRLGSATVHRGVAAMETVWDRAAGNLEADPRLADPAAGDYRPRADSPLVDSGREHDVYRRFYDLYGLDIRRDQAGAARPQGAGWDRGALEHRAASLARTYALRELTSGGGAP